MADVSPLAPVAAAVNDVERASVMSKIRTVFDDGQLVG